MQKRLFTRSTKDILEIGLRSGALGGLGCGTLYDHRALGTFLASQAAANSCIR